MSKYVKVSKFEILDDMFYKKEKVGINGKTFRTPIKTVDATKLHSKLKISNDIRGLNEIYKSFNFDRLSKLLIDNKKSSELYSQIKNNLNKTDESDTNFCFIMYEDQKLPDEKGINYLMNLAYIHSDATPLPILPKFFQGEMDINKRISNYINFMKKCIDSINRLNNKPILGVIPAGIPAMFIEEILGFYYANDITSFVYDFSGKATADISKLREFQININTFDDIEKTFTFSANANNGKMLHGAPVVIAKDILTYGYGFDALGNQHIRKFLPPEVVEKIKEKIKGPKTLRLFNTDDYGYYKSSELSVLNEIYAEKSTEIPFDTFKSSNKSMKDKAQFLFNIEQIGQEALKYQKIIEERSNAKNYLETKNHVESNSLKQLLDFKNEIKI